MSSIRRIRRELEEQDRWRESIAQEVRKSRIVIRPDDTSYLDGVGIYVSTITRRLLQNVSYETLMNDYPGLNKDDIHSCLKFEMARNTGKL